MLTRYLIILFSALSLTSCAQTKLVKKSYAFTAVRIPGNIPVGPDRKPLIKVPDTVTVIYLEIKADSAPTWKYAWKNGKMYSAFAQKVSGNSAEVGKRKTDNTEVALSAEKGNDLWIVTLSPAEEQKPSPKTLGPDEILLQGISGDKIIYYRISKSVELATEESI